MFTPQISQPNSSAVEQPGGGWIVNKKLLIHLPFPTADGADSRRRGWGSRDADKKLHSQKIGASMARL